MKAGGCCCVCMCRCTRAGDACVRLVVDVCVLVVLHM